MSMCSVRPKKILLLRCNCGVPLGIAVRNRDCVNVNLCERRPHFEFLHVMEHARIVLDRCPCNIGVVRTQFYRSIKERYGQKWIGKSSKQAFALRSETPRPVHYGIFLKIRISHAHDLLSTASCTKCYPLCGWGPFARRRCHRRYESWQARARLSHFNNVRIRTRRWKGTITAIFFFFTYRLMYKQKDKYIDKGIDSDFRTVFLR